MQRNDVTLHERPLSKRHESRNQELRHDRKAEDQRLDKLKKTLQAKINVVRAA